MGDPGTTPHTTAWFCGHVRLSATKKGATLVGTRIGTATAVAAALLFGLHAPAWAQDSARPLTFETALRDNPGLRALRLGRGVVASDVPLARQRPNPDVLYEGTRETPHHALTLSLPIETAGKRGRREDVAEAEAQTTDARSPQPQATSERTCVARSTDSWSPSCERP